MESSSLPSKRGAIAEKEGSKKALSASPLRLKDDALAV
jgi:hypothetical protein